jgi:hypothetical protein
MRLHPIPAVAAAALLLLASAYSQTQTPAQAAEAYTTAHQADLIRQFSDFLSIPNVAADPAGLSRNADLLLHELQRRNIDAQLLTIPNAPAVVFGQLNTPGAQHTIVFYAHYDGQPVTPSEWDIPTPFTPTLRTINGEPRIYARSPATTKPRSSPSSPPSTHSVPPHPAPGQHPLRLGRRRRSRLTPPRANPHGQLASLVHGDVFLICDGPVDQSGGKQTVVFGARGDTHLAITLYGPQPRPPQRPLRQLGAQPRDDARPTCSLA